MKLLTAVNRSSAGPLYDNETRESEREVTLAAIIFRKLRSPRTRAMNVEDEASPERYLVVWEMLFPRFIDR